MSQAPALASRASGIPAVRPSSSRNLSIRPTACRANVDAPSWGGGKGYVSNLYVKAELLGAIEKVK